MFDVADYGIGIAAAVAQSPLMFVIAALLILIRHWPWLAGGFLSIFGVREVTPFWCKVFPAMERYLGDSAAPDITSSGGDEDDENDTADPQEQAENAAKRNSEKAETPQQSGEKQTETFSFAETEAKVADALARLVISGDLQKTPAIQKGLQGKSGEAYQAKKALLDAAIERNQPPKYRELDENLKPKVKV